MSMTTETFTSSGRLWPAASAALLAALDRQVGLDARTARGLSNHLPMELVALDAMGAPPGRLEEMLTGWARELSPRTDTTVFDAFLAEVTVDGIEATVTRHLARFADMPSSEWFHSMIRLSYALDAGHRGQVASALADWTAYGRVLPGEAPAGGEVAALEVLRRLHDADLERGPSHADLATVARQERFRDIVAPVVVDPGLDDVAAAVAAVHVGGSNLATLHLVTGVQAARRVLRLADPTSAARFRRRVVQAALAGYVAAGVAPIPSTAELDSLRTAPAPTWDEVRVAAIASPDVHVTKLVYTCRTEQAATGDRLYAWLAARAVGLV
jgi:hypothetical protein